MKVAIIGLDCAAPALVFERWREELPNLGRLMAEGAHGRLLSSSPPITIPAWACMMSSKDPGQLGIYGFRNRKDHSYDAYSIANATALGDDAIWHRLGRAGKQVMVVGVPPSFPPKPLNGVQVGCFLTPSTRQTYTHPPEVQAEVERAAGGYVVDVDDFRTEDKQALLERIHVKTRKHFAVVRHLLTSRPWDFFITVEMGVDRIHHAFWKYMDPTHPKHEPGNPFQESIREYYRFVDGLVGETLALLPPETAVFVISDHGARKLDGGICINEWLIREGYLTLKSYPDRSTPIGKAQIDWSRTRAWGDGGYYGRVFLNVKGREPQGTIEPADYERTRDRLIEGLAAIADPQGRNIGTRTFRPQELYRECRGVPPDLLVYFGDLSWRSIGSVGLGSIHTFENDTGPDDANHDWEGIFIMRLPPGRSGPRGELRGLRLYDVAPTVLDLFGMEPSPGMIGKSIL